MPDSIEPLYNALVGKTEGAAARDLKGDETSARLVALAIASHSYLETTAKIALISKVPGKTYFMFRDAQRGKSSRPVNADLYLEKLDVTLAGKILNCELEEFSSSDINKIIYTIGISYCCAADLLKKSDQKTPGTYFEFLIGHLVARSLGVNPDRQVLAPTLDMNVMLPTDFVFDLGAGKNRVHLPIKTSTRERVVQVWAHQRVLDGMHGTGRFKGVLVALAETNKQQEASVVEVCLPNQWIAYQMYIAQMFRVYYLDPPDKYIGLKEKYPFIQVKPFGEFFNEVELISGAG